MEFTVHIFSTRDSSWKVIGAPDSSFPGYGMSIFTPRSSFPEYNGVPLLVSNGACHWVRNWVPEPAIYAFDLAEEEFRKLPLPLALMPELPNGLYARQIYTQVLREGCLCVWTWNCYGYAEFWEMKEYGVPESWVKLFHFSVFDLPDIFVSTIGWTPVLVTEGGTVVFDLYGKKFYGDRELVRVKCHREEKPVCSGRCKIEGVIEGLAEYAVMVYDETLLSV
uniref:F-box protein CPR30-like n=1 Tax=Fragaria vesca subsp. vesca TaxID=101020 RepID=UPI0005C9D761|nr:PREDICTED: F-box protein CPR30-like [Fragaria vesca subsp. vesca]XP_004294918.2 PREDICTED: F-box protein CPR30-like [Fragaria vesca subsp. vesca]XP_011461607.1 PREDICTED: F-box protein CPR30-like [Fragaria vesca subsp. vesca]XP_011461608.1 PREDICTED: F-box protein CPR30-like [Fragaria vesca subsp. vesca]